MKFRVRLSDEIIKIVLRSGRYGIKATPRNKRVGRHAPVHVMARTSRARRRGTRRRSEAVIVGGGLVPHALDSAANHCLYGTAGTMERIRGQESDRRQKIR